MTLLNDSLIMLMCEGSPQLTNSPANIPLTIETVTGCDLPCCPSYKTEAKGTFYSFTQVFIIIVCRQSIM